MTGNVVGPSGRIDFDGWPSWTARVVGELEAELPAVGAASRAALHLVLKDGDGRRRATAEVPFAIVPRGLGDIDVAELADRAGVTITDRLGHATLERVRAGGARGGPRVGAGVDRGAPGAPRPPARPPPVVRVPRRAGCRARCGRGTGSPRSRGRPAERWLTSRRGSAWTWRSSASFPITSLAGTRAPTQRRWLRGCSPAGSTRRRRSRSSLPLGAGHLVVTTFRLDPDNGPIARALLADLIGLAGESRRSEEHPRAVPAP